MSIYESMTNEQLREALQKALRASAEHLAEAARIWAILRSRGVEMHSLGASLRQMLGNIADGKLAPEAAAVFLGTRGLLVLLAHVPLEEQHRLAAGGVAVLAQRQESGAIVRLERLLSEVTYREACLMIGPNGLRSFADQRAILVAQAKIATPVRKSTGSVATVRADVQNGLLLVGSVRLAPKDIALALAELGFELVRKPQAQAA